MTDITDIKSILYTEKSMSLQENNVVVVQTSRNIDKNSLKEILRKYFDVKALKINSLNQSGKIKRFRGRLGRQKNYKKFFVKLPQGAKIESVSV